MKFSSYNYILKDGERFLYYNTNTDGIIALTPDTHNIVKECLETPDLLQNRHPKLYEAFSSLKFIVNDIFDEYDELVKELLLKSNTNRSYHLTVNPTMDCNFRCWYCYEEHNHGSFMNTEIVESVNKLITMIAENPDIDELVLSFFGGEPLLYYEQTMSPIIKHAYQICKVKEKQMKIDITTNGFLLQEAVIKDLLMYSHVSVQIPIDGSYRFHNKVKFLVDKTETYDVVTSNAVEAIKRGLDVTIRCNYTLKNIYSFMDLLDAFIPYKKANNLMFSFHKVWQEPLSPKLKDAFNLIFNKFIERGFKVYTNTINKVLCYADYTNSAVVNFNGDIFKCTARNFTREERLGELLNNGNIKWNAKSLIRKECKYKSEICSKCKLFPICMQGCSQNAYENEQQNSCLLGYSDEYKKELIEQRISYLLK